MAPKFWADRKLEITCASSQQTESEYVYDEISHNICVYLLPFMMNMN